jgi:hypothetical protein
LLDPYRGRNAFRRWAVCRFQALLRPLRCEDTERRSRVKKVEFDASRAINVHIAKPIANQRRMEDDAPPNALVFMRFVPSSNAMGEGIVLGGTIIRAGR